MTLFEPLFLLLLLVALLTLLTAAAYAGIGRRARAVRLLRRLAIGAGCYFALVIAVTAVAPRKVYRVGEEQRFDDWCIAVTAAGRLPDPPHAYEVSLRLSNRSVRTPMGERGTVVYLTDGAGHRYDPLPDPSAMAFDTRLAPEQSVDTTRRFAVPPDAQGLGLVYTHEGGFPIGWLIVGEGGWFASPPIVRLATDGK